MTIELRVASGARAGHRQAFDGAVVTIGRDPRSDLRLDAGRDLDVSARHAELRSVDGVWRVRDCGSTNGTFVNGTRISAEQALGNGDVIALGADGPRIEVKLAPVAVSMGAPASTQPTRAPRGRTMERIEAAVRTRTGALRRALIALSIVLIAAVVAAFWMGRRGVAERDVRLAELVAQNDSLDALWTREIAALSGRMAGLDAALAEAQQESDELRSALERERSRSSPGALESLATRLDAAQARSTALVSAARMDHAAIAAENGGAVVLIAVEMPDGSRYTATGFGVDHRGRIVTNRHVVRDSAGATPRRLAVIYSDTRRWLPARVVRASEAAEVALLKVEVAGRYPVVAGFADDATIAVGSPVTVIGYPLGLDTPMDGGASEFTARASLGVGTVSKILPELVQIDAWAGQGSSGSPVFDANGRVAAVIFGGARESAGRIVYAVPASTIKRFVLEP